MNKRIFISHASEDKEKFVRQLAIHLRKCDMDIWYDEYEIKPGMSIRESVDKGLALCDVGILVLSPDYFKKKWTIWELNGIVQKMLNGRAQIIPIWLNISHTELLEISPSLADILGLSSEKGLSYIVSEIYKLVYPQEPVLVKAREILSNYGYNAPDYYDNWWLDTIEFLGHGHAFSPWCLPRNPGGKEKQSKSTLIAWSGLRHNWITKCTEMQVNQFTPPNEIMNIIETTPGMYEACGSNINYLALYAPQLLFYKNSFTEAFIIASDQMKKRVQSIEVNKSYVCLLTKDAQIPSCNRIYALIDKDCGMYLPIYLLMHFVEGESIGPKPSRLSYWEVLINLCSARGDIYPANVKEVLLAGFRNKYVTDKLKDIFIDQNEERITKLFSDINAIEQIVKEVVSDYSINILEEPGIIARKIFKMKLFDTEYEKLFVRLTIPKEDMEYGFRGITYQNE